MLYSLMPILVAMNPCPSNKLGQEIHRLLFVFFVYLDCVYLKYFQQDSLGVVQAVLRMDSILMTRMPLITLSAK